jgi:hypothetical protein
MTGPWDRGRPAAGGLGRLATSRPAGVISRFVRARLTCGELAGPDDAAGAPVLDRLPLEAGVGVGDDVPHAAAPETAPTATRATTAHRDRIP